MVHFQQLQPCVLNNDHNCETVSHVVTDVITGLNIAKSGTGETVAVKKVLCFP